MLFNSIDFALFLPIVFISYWFFFNRNLKLQNLFLVIVSYVFYGWWDIRFLSLIIISTIIDYFVGIKIANASNGKAKKSYLLVSIFANLGFLGFFKYYNFFLENFKQSFSFFGIEFESTPLDIVLPVGISFYTFQTLSYSIDVYRGKLKPTKNFISFAAFVCFFPQLVAGPIERATHLLPQFFKKRKFDYKLAKEGMRQILWGLFKKVVIADNCAQFANQAFNETTDLNSSSLILGAFFFAIQIYGDFSGYSDIAIGTSRLFGFDLMQNFKFPYFSRDISEFWRRWHISLSTWFRDYLYIPLGGSKGSRFKKIKNTFIIFLVSGFWHGANWTFIAWGFINALFFLPLLLTNRNRRYLDEISKNRFLPNIKETLLILKTFSLTVLAWIFFRAENITHALIYIEKIVTNNPFTLPNLDNLRDAFYTLLFVTAFFIVEWTGRNREFAIEKLNLKAPVYMRWLFYLLICLSIIMFSGDEQEFIYFQF